MLSICGLLLGAISNSLFISVPAVIAFWMCPLAIAVNRIKHHEDKSLMKVVKCWIIGFYFIAGRSVGFLRECKGKLTGGSFCV
jgi:hypothetical protein